MVLFSTGRGTRNGGFVPTAGTATNSELAAKKKHWIHFDAGQSLTVKRCRSCWKNSSTPLLSLPTESKPVTERNDFRELAIFKSGVNAISRNELLIKNGVSELMKRRLLFHTC
ncbi:hypothetical protein ACLK1T_16775 [Escherichia coli]